ncbi:AAA family ATPase [Malacoplasma iowae]|uniref:AAA family ATPase n=1 Tax=Malacoplasma iowae TaxID=2116 RepID=UPI002A18BF02|nr:AAA family ATPase [Malacoplasma iowae]WPL37425.1 AAA family ATPase [Malacoplasma iowae]
MIFLKKFEARGFKSFADYTKLNFDCSMIGIVGPNGSGKSNVIDAVKWVLGEKSIKSLRGKKSDDVIFHGSKTKPANDFAEVTLTFDNSKRVLHIDLDEVSITRRLYRGNGNNDYFINGEQARLKDIMDVFVDTGLSKGSLGIISQGTVNWFADSKPEDRRTIFEEAAGIGLYTRKKEESLRQLERTQNNLNRLIDITKELSRDIKKLEQQASKVKEYSEKKEELTKLEISILVKDIVKAQSELDNISSKLNTSKSVNQDLAPKLEQLGKELSANKEALEQADIKVGIFSNELNNIITKINKLEIEKAALDNDIQIDMNSTDFQSKVNALANLVATTEAEVKSKSEIVERNKKEAQQYEEQVMQLESEKNEKQKILVDLIKANTENKANLNHLEDLIKNKMGHEGGAKVIIENKEALTGILGTVLDFIKVEPNYEKAIMLALGKNISNIVVNTHRDAKRAIDFLNNNKAGIATFMPVYEMKPKEIKKEHQEILEHLPGFIGLASQLLTKVDKKIQPIIDVLLGRIIIAENYDTAIDISKYTFQLYKIITLDGQIINPQGSITGGYNEGRIINSLTTLENKRKELNKSIEELDKQILKVTNRTNEIDLLLVNFRNRCNECRLNESKYSDQLKWLEQDFIKYKVEYEKLSRKSYTSDSANVDNEYKNINDRLNSLINTKEKVENDLNVNQNSKKILKNRIYEIEDEIEKIRETMSLNNNVILEFDKKEIMNFNIISNAKEKLNNNYKMTIETAIQNYSEPLPVSDNVARQKIDKLTKELNYIGPINMDAINELKEKSERYEKMRAEEIEISEAKEEIINVIKELDSKAHEDFYNTIQKINEELPKTFKYLFGGGSCSIEFTEPNNILESGIDIKASPPGKNINSLFALSGGEKTLVALSVLFSILKISSFPLVILDEAESALDPSNVERFGNIISNYSTDTQFLVITHRPGTMERCDKLYGATMQTQGVTSIYQVKVQDAKKDFGSDEIIEDLENK